MALRIAPRERTAILQSLSAGVVPAIGLHHLQVGRKQEVEALVKDLELVDQGASAVRFVIGRFGSGKTFFMNLIRNVALQRRFVVIQADITTERRLHGTGGQARSLYSELVRNLGTRSRPEGNALSNLVEKWIGETDHAIRSAGGQESDVTAKLHQSLKPLQELVGGFDFVTVITRYYEGYLSHNETLQEQGLRWLRGEFTTKTEAREALGVRTFIDDAGFYDHLKLLAAFVRIAGYAGMVVNVDELVVLSHRLPNTLARNKNYEALLRILNDCLQGHVQGLMFLFAGTDECLVDQRRGLYSYEALATRLAPNRFANQGHKNLHSPVIHLENLSPEDCYVLLCNIRRVHSPDEETRFISDEGIAEYLKACSERMGAAYFMTPRDTVKDFVNLVQVLEQNPESTWQSLVRPATRALGDGNGHVAGSNVPAVDSLDQIRL